MQNFSTEVPGTPAPDINTNAPAALQNNLATQQPLTNTVVAAGSTSGAGGITDSGIKRKKRPMMKLAIDEKRSEPSQQLGQQSMSNSITSNYSQTSAIIQNQTIVQTNSNPHEESKQQPLTSSIQSQQLNNPTSITSASSSRYTNTGINEMVTFQDPQTVQQINSSITSVGTIRVGMEMINISEELNKLAPTIDASGKIKSFQSLTVTQNDQKPSSQPSGQHQQQDNQVNSGQMQMKSSLISFSKQQETELQQNSNQNTNSKEPGTTQEAPVIEGNKKISDDDDGVKLSDIIVMENIGSGAQGTVRKAVHKPSRKFIAMKEIPLLDNIKVQKAILLELKTLHECDCENILRSYGSFLKDGNVNIALEFMDMGSLAGVLQKVKNIPENILGIITYQTLLGFHYLHKVKKVAHRDIKPSNILINSGGNVKIADFGVSGNIQLTNDCMTSWVGTVTYMSPERIQGDKYFLDTDLWSLGIMILECAIGRFPYPDPDDTTVKELGFWELMQYITVKNSPKLPSENNEFSQEFQDFLSICLRKKGGTRSNAAELLEHPWIQEFAKADKKLLRRWLKANVQSKS